MPKKSAIDPKEGQGPGYSSAGYIGKGTEVLMTYRVSGLKSDASRQRVRDALWTKFRKGLSTGAQTWGEHQTSAGPQIDGEDVVYTLSTMFQGAEREEEIRKEVQRLTGGQVAMSYVAAPALPPAIPGIDAPALVELKAAA